ncbi:DUF1311 domain-containing protein [Bryocella elongata]|nr:DUF1311 domain-containing protein [Bryocella elongata]
MPAEVIAPATEAHQALPTPPPYDPAIFRHALPSAELAPLLGDNGLPSGQIYGDRAMHKLLHSAAPDVMFHYGRDVTLPDTLDMSLSGSSNPVVVRDNRYISLSGSGANMKGWMRHDGKILLWVDTQDGVMLGAFFFKPTNGEPTPTVTVFGKQIKRESITLSELPPGFEVDLEHWEQANGLPTVSILYFIGDTPQKLPLIHDNDYCLSSGPATGPTADCDQSNAEAADDDLVAASYLEQVAFAPNATARMISDPSQEAWEAARNDTCGRGPNPMRCRVVMTRERIRKIAPRPARGGGRR